MSFTAFAGPSCDIVFHHTVLPTTAEDRPLDFSPRSTIDGTVHAFVQFERSLDATGRQQAAGAGIDLLSYVPCNTYVAAWPKGTDLDVLDRLGATAIVQPRGMVKRHLSLRSTSAVPDHALSGDGELMVHATLFRAADRSALVDRADRLGWTVRDDGRPDHVLSLTIKPRDLGRLADLPSVLFIEPVDPPSEPENRTGATLARSNVISDPLGRAYDGRGIVIGHQDDGAIENDHADWTGRVTHAAGPSSGDHGDHIAGTLIGAGNRDPRGRGLAFGARLYYTSVYDIVNDMANRFNIDSVLITSTSYSNGCNAGYTSFAQQHDQQVLDLPGLMHVFSAGNSGFSNCGYGAGSGWGNVTGGHKQGKNVLAVANSDDEDVINGSSSRGPAHDGRIKPDIAAKGTSVYSTTDLNATGYTSKTGTSMSCPMVAATLAQLYQAYRDINGVTAVPSDVLKCVLLNSADDIGNTGPDYTWGWGRTNALEAVEMLESNNILIDQVDNGGSNTHSLTVPAGTEQVNVMVYWHDVTATVGASTALVNDLDMTVTTPGGSTRQPWVLDPTPNAANLSAPATTGVDRLNNVEQITIDNPSAGTHTIDISGFNVPFGPQRYVLTWQLRTDDITVTFPNGGEHFEPGQSELVRWDALGDAGSFTVELSTDGGGSWSSIGTASGAHRFFDWTVPNTPSDQVRIRVSRGSTTDVSDADAHIMDVPTGLALSDNCPGEAFFTWNATPGADRYVVFALGTNYMEPIDTVSTNSAVVSGLTIGASNWYSVQAIHTNGAVGERAVAIDYTHTGTGTCHPIDLTVTDLIAPGRSGCQFSASEPVSLEVTSFGSNTVAAGTAVTIGMRLDGGTVVTENTTIASALNTGQLTSLSFTGTIDLSATGSYVLETWVTIAGDGNTSNDTLTTTISNDPAITTYPYNENFETWTICGNSNDCDLDCGAAVANGWVQSTGDDQDWRVDNGETASADTGPDRDHDPGTTSGQYIYTESSATCDLQVFDILTPCFDLAGLTNPEAEFYYHMYGVNMGTLELQVSNDDGSSWTTLWSQTGEVQTADDDPWQRAVANLSAYTNDVVILRFRGTTGSDYRSDMAIDAFRLFDNDCVPLTLPFSEDFDGVTVPDLPLCWTTNNSQAASTTATCAGSTINSLQVEGVDGAYALSPVLDASGATEVVVSFAYRRGDDSDCGNTPEAADNLDVEYWDGSQWVVLDNYAGSTAPATFTPTSYTISSGLTGQFQLRFRHQNGSGLGFDNYDFDDVQIFTTTCPSPTAFTASAITTSGADLAWTDNASAPSFQVSVGPAGTPPGGGTVSTTSTPNLTLTGLVPATDHVAHVRAICAPGDTSIWTSLDFTTDGSCGAFLVVLEDTYGDGWNGGSIDIYRNGSLQVSGAAVTTGFGPDTVRIMTNTDDVLSIDYAEGNWPEENEIRVIDQTGTEVATSGLGGVIPDDIGDFTIPTGIIACETCPAPSNLQASGATPTSIDLSWTNGGSETAWQLAYGPVGTTPGTATVVAAPTNPFTLTGLTPGSAYEVFVRAICAPGDTSQWLTPPTGFATACGSVSLPFSEDFDGVGIPALPLCWTTNDAAAAFTTDDCSGSTINSLQVNGGTGVWAETPVIDASGASVVEISYAYRAGDDAACGENPDNGDIIAVEYWDGTTWTALTSYDGATAPPVFTPDSFTVSTGLTAQFQLRFFVVSGSGPTFDNYNFDDVVITTDCPPTTTSVAAAICDDESYVLPGGSTVNTADVYRDTLTSSAGCDSIVVTDLVVHPTRTSTVVAGICSGTPYTLPDGTVTSTPGLYIDTIATVNGCDSIITTDLSVGTTYDRTDSASICAGETYALPTGVLVGTADTYRDTLTTMAGCDSVINTVLTVRPVFARTDSLDRCTGDTVVLADGRDITTSGSYDVTLTATNGCDSTITTVIDFASPTTALRRDTLCSGGSVTLPDGSVVSTGGVYPTVLTNAAGCDSIVTTVVEDGVSYDLSSAVTLCPDDTILFGGAEITMPGTYADTFATALGCDSIVRLTVSAGSDATVVVHDTICRSDSLFFGDSWIHGTGTTIDTLTTATGCDSIVTLSVVEDTFDRGILVGTTTLTAVEDGPGVRYQWYDCVANTFAADDTNRVFTPSATGLYGVVLSNDRCVDSLECAVITLTGLHDLDALSLTVRPNPSTGRFEVTTTNANTLRWTVRDVTGRTVAVGSLRSRTTIDLTEQAAGVYLLEVRGERGRSVVKLVKD
mgnify:CR=1 FL=1